MGNMISIVWIEDTWVTLTYHNEMYTFSHMLTTQRQAKEIFILYIKINAEYYRCWTLRISSSYHLKLKRR